MVKTDIDNNPLDPNYEKRRSSIGNMEHQQQDQSNIRSEDLMLDSDVAPCVYITIFEVYPEVSHYWLIQINRTSVSPQPAHQHAPEYPRRSSSQDVDHSMSLLPPTTTLEIKAFVLTNIRFIPLWYKYRPWAARAPRTTRPVIGVRILRWTRDYTEVTKGRLSSELVVMSSWSDDSKLRNFQLIFYILLVCCTVCCTSTLWWLLWGNSGDVTVMSTPHHKTRRHKE